MNNYYITNKETNKIELHFDKASYMGVDRIPVEPVDAESPTKEADDYTVTLEAVGATEYKQGLNVRYMSKPFYLEGKKVTLCFGAHTKGTVYPEIYEENEKGEIWGNPKRMEKAGYWKRYQDGFPVGYQVIPENLPEYSKSGIIEAITKLYPELSRGSITFSFVG